MVIGMNTTEAKYESGEKAHAMNLLTTLEETFTPADIKVPDKESSYTLKVELAFAQSH
jgi:hypothetical protein